MNKLAVILVLLALLMAGCNSPAEAGMRYLALGDSYTIGEGVAENERWPVQLATALGEGGQPFAVVDIIARTGWTTRELQAAIERQYDGGTYDLVSVLIGVNDQYRGIPVEDYRPRLRELLAFAIGAAGGRPERVFMLSIPDWGVTPFAEGLDRAAIGAQIDGYNAVAAEEAAAAEVRFFDITPISRQAAQRRGLLAADGLHPSGEMYAAWVELIATEVAALLATQ
jgi:lysophospholipase L1-like esterase